jgi:HAD superfamily hydrolase (TIGR01490 family)
MSIHFFDVDYTLVRQSTSYYFLREGLSQGILSFRQLRQLPFEWFRYKIGRANLNFIEQAVTQLGGMDRKTVDDLAQSCFTRRLKANIYTQGKQYIRDLLGRGEGVYLATSSFRFLIEPLEQFLSLSDSLASTLEFAGGKTTGRLLGKALFGENKKTAAQEWLRERNIPPEDLWFYSDSYTDLPLLEFCGHPVAVNPDRFLVREAKKRGWEILRWKETLGKA